MGNELERQKQKEDRRRETNKEKRKKDEGKRGRIMRIIRIMPLEMNGGERQNKIIGGKSDEEREERNPSANQINYQCLEPFFKWCCITIARNRFKELLLCS